MGMNDGVSWICPLCLGCGVSTAGRRNICFVTQFLYFFCDLTSHSVRRSSSLGGQAVELDKSQLENIKSKTKGKAAMKT